MGYYIFGDKSDIVRTNIYIESDRFQNFLFLTKIYIYSSCSLIFEPAYDYIFRGILDLYDR